MSYHLQAALACERHKTLLAEAEAFRQAKQAQTHRQRARDVGRPARRRWPGWLPAHGVVLSTETPR